MKQTQKLTLSAFFLALGLILPFLTGQIPTIGSMLLPMHIPVLLCGLLCGAPYGLLVGLILPLLRTMTFGMPPIHVSIVMTFELATYGFVIGWMYHKAKWQCVKTLYISLISAMICGRIVWGLAQIILLSVQGSSLTISAFIAASITQAIPGIILQLILIPTAMVALDKARVRPFKKATSTVSKTSF